MTVKQLRGELNGWIDDNANVEVKYYDAEGKEGWASLDYVDTYSNPRFVLLGSDLLTDTVKEYTDRIAELEAEIRTLKGETE